MLLRVGLRSSVLRDARFLAARSGRPRPLDDPFRLLRGCSYRPRLSPLRASGRPRGAPRGFGAPPARGFGAPLAVAPRDDDRSRAPDPRRSGRPPARGSGRPRSLPARPLPPELRPERAAPERPEPDRPDWSRAASRRGFRGGSSTGRPVVRRSHDTGRRDDARLDGRASSFEYPRQRPTLPEGLPPSTIGAGGLNGRVRNGNGCVPAAMATGKSRVSAGLRALHSEHERLQHVVCAIKPSAD